MAENVVITKTWGEHQAEKRLKQKELNDFFLFFIVAIIFVAIFTWLINSIRLFSLGASVYISVFLFILAIILFKFRRRIFKRRRKSSHNFKKEWRRIDRLPSWAFKKMKRRKTNRVNGDHYTYKREGNKFYKRLK